MNNNADAPPPRGPNTNPCLLQTLEQLEALLIHALCADTAAISPSSRASLLALAHDLVCSAMEQAQHPALPQ